MILPQLLLINCRSGQGQETCFFFQIHTIFSGSLASASVYMACRGESNSMSEGMMASAPYTRKKGVNPVDRFGVVLRLHNIAGSSSIHAPGALSRGAISLGLIPDKMRPFARSA